MKQVKLDMALTSSTCMRYRLLDASGQMLWQNRVTPSPEGEAAARARLDAWLAKHEVTLLEPRLAKGA